MLFQLVALGSALLRRWDLAWAYKTLGLLPCLIAYVL